MIRIKPTNQDRLGPGPRAIMIDVAQSASISYQKGHMLTLVTDQLSEGTDQLTKVGHQGRRSVISPRMFCM